MISRKLKDRAKVSKWSWIHNMHFMNIKRHLIPRRRSFSLPQIDFWMMNYYALMGEYSAGGRERQSARSALISATPPYFWTGRSQTQNIRSLRKKIKSTGNWIKYINRLISSVALLHLIKTTEISISKLVNYKIQLQLLIDFCSASLHI